TYRLKFRSEAPVTALRLEVLSDDRLPRHGPGRVFYEGPFGDFQLSEFTVRVGSKPVKIARATASYHAGNATIDKAIDGQQQTGWSVDGGQGRPHYAVFQLAEPLPAGEFEVSMLFERYCASGLGRFRISATSAAKIPDARDASNDIEALLLMPDENLTLVQRELLRKHFIATTPVLAKQRQEIDALRKQMPAFPTTLVMHERPLENPRPTFVHNRGEFLQPTERVEPGVLSILPPLREGAN